MSPTGDEPLSVQPMQPEPRPCNLRVWITDLTYTQQAISADLIPAGVAAIATYAEQLLQFPEPIRIFKYPEALAEDLAEAQAEDRWPDVVGLSNYIWNGNLSLAFAKRIKEVSPKTKIVLGGPNYPTVPAEQERFLRDHPEVDFYIVKEGEIAFARLCEALSDNNNDATSVHGQIGSVHSLDASGKAHLPDPVDRIRDLTEIPSPYLSGRLDAFFDGQLLPIIQTNRGCPFTCTFCVEGSKYYGKVYRNTEEKVAAEIDYIGAMMARSRAKGGRNDLFIADSNFGMYRNDLDTCRAIAKAQSEHKWPEYINVATGKNQKERVLEAARLINGALRLSGSVQSLDEEVLSNIKRSNIAPDQLMLLALDAADVGANSYSETILCLPGDSKIKHYDTLRRVIEAGFNMVSTFQLMLLPGSEMCTEQTKEEHGMLLRYRVFPRCYGHYEVLGKALIAAEIEEVCVGLNTLPFSDYLECRHMHLMIHMFHNDGVFAAVLKFLRQEKLPVFRWIELLREMEPPPGLKRLVDDFLEETQNELWQSREDLDAFVSTPGNIERYIAGELGNNLLFTYKSKGIIDHIEDLATHARAATQRVLAEAGRNDDETIAFIDDALLFQTCRARNIFYRRDEVPSVKLHYDIAAYESDLEVGPLNAYYHPASVETRFVLSAEQQDLMDRYLKVFGDSPWGIGRMLTKVFVKRLLRHPETAEISVAAGNLAGDPTAISVGGTRG